MSTADLHLCLESTDLNKKPPTCSAQQLTQTSSIYTWSAQQCTCAQHVFGLHIKNTNSLFLFFFFQDVKISALLLQVFFLLKLFSNSLSPFLLSYHQAFFLCFMPRKPFKIFQQNRCSGLKPLFFCALQMQLGGTEGWCSTSRLNSHHAVLQFRRGGPKVTPMLRRPGCSDFWTQRWPFMSHEIPHIWRVFFSPLGISENSKASCFWHQNFIVVDDSSSSLNKWIK